MPSQTLSSQDSPRLHEDPPAPPQSPSRLTALSIRLTHLDHYRLPLASLSASTPFLAARLSHITPSHAPSSLTLPVLRLFGRTSDAHSVCVHLHGLRPYLLVPLPSALSPTDVPSYLSALHHALEALLARAVAPSAEPTTATPMRRIDSVSPAWRTPTYGFTRPRPFARVATFHPSTPPALAPLLLGVPSLLPDQFKHLPAPIPAHDAHIPFTLQFLTDYGFSPMDTVSFSHAFARHPISTSTTLSQWPFRVPRRAAVDIEVDVFANDIIPSPPPPPSLNFVSKTLAGIWEEERLRTGTMPPRVPGAIAGVVRPTGVKNVPPGAHLSDPEGREMLANTIANQLEHNAAVHNAKVDDDTDEQFADVLDYLDASPEAPPSSSIDRSSAPSSALDLQPADIHPFPANERRHDLLARPEEEDEPPLGPADEDEEDDADVEQAWHDIASCTQSHSNDLPPPASTTPPSAPISQPPQTPPILEHTLARATPTPTQSLPLTAPRHTLVRPKQRPPLLSEPIGPGDPIFSIDHITPFSSEEQPPPPIRRAGAAGLPLFPAIFASFDPSQRVEILTRVVTPVRKPPLASDLPQLDNDYAEIGTTGPGAALDTAGRLIRVSNAAAPSLTSQQGLSLLQPPPELPGARQLGQDGPTSSASPRTPKRLLTSRGLQLSETPRLRIGNDTPARMARPLSPKYDEQFLPSQLVLTGSHSREHKKSLGDTPRTTNRYRESSFIHERNETATPSQSPHRFQNVVTLSIEVLAASYGNRLPDPMQNGVLAVCAVAHRDKADLRRTPADVVLYAVQPPTRLSAVINVIARDTEPQLFDALAAHFRSVDPDFIVGFETQRSSIGYLLERAAAISHPFANTASRWLKGPGMGMFAEGGPAGQKQEEEGAAARYFQRKGADIKMVGRHILNIWRIVRSEVKLSAYSREMISQELFGVTFPLYSNRDLEDWYSGKQAEVAVLHLKRMTLLNLALVDKLNVLSRTGELARVFGIEVMSVINRGSQYRVESMLRRVALARQYALLSAVREEVFRQPAVEALPLVMEPESALYVDPVIVLDFQSLYPSVVIAHNLCFSTMLGNVRRIERWGEARRVGVLPNYTPPSLEELRFDPMEHVFVSSSGEMFVDASIRRGLLPQMLEEILETRVMVKKAMKELCASDEATNNLLNARQFGLKMIANVTYGYTSASFSGRMPCAGLADAIVQCGRDALEQVIRYVDSELRETTGARVVYGDTDSLFVQVRGATRDEAFEVGETIVRKAAEMFPKPMALKLEKVYQPCLLQTKKRYVGYAYESRSQAIPIFDAKGIETVRRDSCPLVQKALERTLRLLFETKDLTIVRKDLAHLVRRIQTERVPLSDFIFRKEVRLGTYKEGHLPPAGIVATNAVSRDSRAAPRHGERVAFVVVYDRPGAPLRECVLSPEAFLAARGARLNVTYYITKQLIPTLDRSLGLVGARVAGWYADMPRYIPPASGTIEKPTRNRGAEPQRRLSAFYAVRTCTVCHRRLTRGKRTCTTCTAGPNETAATRLVLERRRTNAQMQLSEAAVTCMACAAWSGARDACQQLACVTHTMRRTANRELARAVSALDDTDVMGDNGSDML